MLSHYLHTPQAQRQYRCGIAGPYLDELSQWFEQRGYQPRCISRRLRGAHRLSMWAEQTGVHLHQLNEQALEAFKTHLYDHDGLTASGAYAAQLLRGARDLIVFLGAIGLIPVAPQPPSADPELLAAFNAWMRLHRGVTETTLRNYRLPLLELLRTLGEQPKQYTAKALRAFLLDRARRHGIAQAKNDVTAVRMFVRYLIAVGRCALELDQAMPPIAQWRLASLPKYLAAEEVERVIASCDLSTPIGVRDRAVLLLLSRLGFRSGDVANLKLSDINWDEATVEVAGKSRRSHRLPLPQDVGDAILSYLEQRPRVACPQVFITTLAPLKALAAPSIGAVAARAIERAGVKAPSHGSHILRHSAATEMLRQGLSLSAIGTVLRHTSIETTAGYAKVDIHLLRHVARPWPEETSC